MTGRLAGKVALVTGGASGIGRAVVERYVEEGARVAVLDRAQERLAQLAADLGAAVVPVTGDATSWDANVAAVERTLTAYGHLDVLVGNVGIFDRMARVDDLPGDALAAAFDELFAINVKSHLLAVKAALPALRETGGAVILTASYAGLAAGGGGPLYTASKHAVVGLVRSLAHELAPRVRVNGVAPGVAPTVIGGVRALGQEPAPAIQPGSSEALPLGRVPETADYGGVYAFLASERDAGAMTGTVVVMDSGLDVRGVAPPRTLSEALADG